MKPLTRDTLLGLCGNILYKSGDGSITFGYIEDSDVTEELDTVVEAINAHFKLDSTGCAA